MTSKSERPPYVTLYLVSLERREGKKEGREGGREGGRYHERERERERVKH